MLKELTEADVLLAQHLDDDLLKFMGALQPYLQDTIVMLMSDHGVGPKQVSLYTQTKCIAHNLYISWKPNLLVNCKSSEKSDFRMQ